METWNIGIDGSYVLCNQHLKTRDHLFFSCTYTSTVRRQLTQYLYGNHFSTDWSSIGNFVSQTKEDRVTLFLARYVFQAAIHTIVMEGEEC